MKTLLTIPDTEIMVHWLQLAVAEYTGVSDFPHYAAEDAPSSYQDLLTWSQGHVLGVDPLPVFSGGSDRSIYGSDSANHLFRAWHDAIHIKEQLRFTEKDELKVSDMHCAVLRYIGAPYAVIKALEADVAGQVKYFYLTGKYVADQLGFVTDCLRYGIETVIHFVEMGARY